MNKLIKLSLFSVLSLFSMFASAGQPSTVPQAPEMDAGMAIIGVGLLAGIVALIAERRRK